MAKTKPQRIKVAEVEAALRASAGIYTAAAGILKRKYGTCSPNTVKAYVMRHQRLQDAKAEIENEILDLTESKLITRIKDGSEKSIHFYLRTKGKHRGYSERLETTGVDGGPIRTETKLDLSDLTSEERDALRPLLERRAREASGGS